MKKTKKMFVFGNTNFAALVKDYFVNFSEYEVTGFVVDKEYITEDTLENLPVISMDQCLLLYPPKEYEAFIAIGYININRIRAEKIKYLQEQGYRLASYIDISSRVFPEAEIGQNCFVMENAVVQRNVKIKDGVVVLPNVCIGHDSIVEECSFIGAGTVLNGNCEIGKNCFFAANTTVNNSIKIADYTVIGSGAHITKNTKQYGIYMVPGAQNILGNITDNGQLEKAQIKFFNGNIRRQA